MPEMHLRHPGFTYSASGPFTKNKGRIVFYPSFVFSKWSRKKKTRDLSYIYQNELDEACFQHDLAYGDFKDLIRRTAADKLLHVKAFTIAKNPKYDGYQRGLTSMVYKFFDKKSPAGAVKN